MYCLSTCCLRNPRNSSPGKYLLALHSLSSVHLKVHRACLHCIVHNLYCLSTQNSFFDCLLVFPSLFWRKHIIALGALPTGNPPLPSDTTVDTSDDNDDEIVSWDKIMIMKMKIPKDNPSFSFTSYQEQLSNSTSIIYSVQFCHIDWLIMQPNDLDHNHNQSDSKEILKTHHHDSGRCSSHSRLGLGRSCGEMLGAVALFVTKHLKHQNKELACLLLWKCLLSMSPKMATNVNINKKHHVIWKAQKDEKCKSENTRKNLWYGDHHMVV